MAVTLSKYMAIVLFLRIKASETAFGTANSSRWLMYSYDSTCDHLQLADLCPKEATYSQFEALVISRKLNTDSISLGPLPPRRVRPPLYRLSGLSVQYKYRGSYPPFHLYLQDTKMYSTHVHSCLEMFESSSERDSIEILIE